ncbi:MAG TPA: hydroxymethylbilane synthase [Solirubrobacterales bacterium]|nr:hydroxymethylbilane synthase [Solirubrobacterales bacterium]
MALRIATRGSTLALTQAGIVAEMLGGAELVEVSSDGEPGDKARFVRAVEQAVLNGEAEIGVHSAKDLPSEMPGELLIAGVPERQDPADAWIGPGSSLDDIPEGARVGTASLRRRAQLLAARPDLRVEELHGNVDTRLRKLAEGDLDGIVLAAAGLRRLGREGEIGFAIPGDQMVPAAGQGVLVLQTRADDEAARLAAEAISDEVTLVELAVERAVVRQLGADCTSPVGVWARNDGGEVTVDGFVGLADGSEWVRHREIGGAGLPVALAELLTMRLEAAGAGEILQRAAA